MRLYLSESIMIVEFLSQLVHHADFSTAVIFLVVAYVTWKLYDGYNLPPGPWGLPILGYLPFVGTKPIEETFNNLSKKYGNIMSMYCGSYLIVIINNYELIKEAYVKQGDNFAGRPQNSLIKIDDEDSGIVVTDGEIWREHRRFILSTMRDYGMGKLSLEPRIMEEINFFLDELAQEKGRPFDLTTILGMSTANIISTLEFGKRFEYKDGRFQRLRKLQESVADLFSNKNPKPFFPWIDKLPFTERLTHSKKLRQINDTIKMFINDMMEEHKSSHNDNSRNDLIDAYLTERNSVIKKTGDEGYFTANEIQSTLMTLFGAGTETITTTLRWGILFMIIYPEIQKRVQKEIDDVIGMERQPTMSDKIQMIYTEAVLLEVQRFGSIIPLNVPHSNLEETTIAGYRIPKRTIILTNLWAVHNDPDFWDEPEKFMPERFISKEGKLQKTEYLLPFGIGKRACVGESLAKTELFLYFTSMLQRFNFQPPKGVTPKLKFESSVARRPTPYEICAVQRSGYSV